MLEKAAWFLLGVLAKWLIRGSVWDSAWMKARRARAQQTRLTDLLMAEADSIRVGSLEIKQMMAQVFVPGVSVEQVDCTWEPLPLKLAPELAQLEFSYLPRKLEQLRAQGKTVDLNDGYALKSVRISRPQVSLLHSPVERHNRPAFTFYPTNFKYYLMLNDALDLPILEKADSIRARFIPSLRAFEWSELPDLPIHSWMGTVCAVLTPSHQLVLALRSGLQAITDRQEPYHFWRAAMSCAEGMLRPKDSLSPPPAETPSPFLTAFRALEDELGLRKGEHYLEREVKLIGLAFDKKRCQPVAVFLLELPGTDFKGVVECWQTAKDRQENAALIPIAVEPKALADLLTGKHKHDGKPVLLFSNHQELGVLLTGLYISGAPGMRRALAA